MTKTEKELFDAAIAQFSADAAYAKANPIDDTAEAQQITKKVMLWLESNAAAGAKKMVEKFGLSYSCEKDYGNGVSKVGFYTDASYQHLVCTLHLPTAEWFRA